MRPLVLVLILAAATSLRAEPPRKMTLVFEDNFDGTVIDSTKWGETWGADSGALRLSEGKLRLGISSPSNGVWNGSFIRSRSRFEQALGYFEASIRFGRHPGHRAVFSLTADPPEENGVKFQELYVADCFGTDTVITWRRINDGKALREEKPKYLTPLPPGKVGDSFNTYGMLWTAREITWYINGRKVTSTRDSVLQDRLFLTLSHLVTEAEISKIDPARLRDDVEVDWVKAWR